MIVVGYIVVLAAGVVLGAAGMVLLIEAYVAWQKRRRRGGAEILDFVGAKPKQQAREIGGRRIW